MPNPVVSNVTVPNSAGTAYTTYDLKDAWARDKITNDILPVLEGGMHYVGVTTSNISDGATTNPVTIVGKTDPVTAVSGDIVTKDSKEFVWDGAAWREFGDMSAIGEFGYVDTGYVTVTPAGTVSKPTFTGSSSSVTFTITKPSSGTNYTPEGTISTPTFTGSSSSVSISASKVTSGDDYTLQLTGSVSAPTFTGTSFTSTGTINVLKSVAVTTNTTTDKTAAVSPAGSGEVTYTPAGTISGTAVSVGSQSISIIDSVGSAATLTTTYTSGTENLQINFSGGSVPTKKSVTVGKSGAATVTQGTFAGTGVRLVTGNIPVPATYTVTPTYEDKTVTVSGTATGNVSAPTFTGDKYKFTGSTTAAGSVSQPTFTGTPVKIAGSTTAAGSVSQPTFSGTEATWVVYPGSPTP